MLFPHSVSVNASTLLDGLSSLMSCTNLPSLPSRGATHGHAMHMACFLVGWLVGDDIETRRPPTITSLLIAAVKDTGQQRGE